MVNEDHIIKDFGEKVVNLMNGFSVWCAEEAYAEDIEYNSMAMQTFEKIVKLYFNLDEELVDITQYESFKGDKI